jgi:hypothetical protein
VSTDTNQPHGVYATIEATRPGEIVMLDTSWLDVIAYDPMRDVTFPVEITIGYVRENGEWEPDVRQFGSHLAQDSWMDVRENRRHFVDRRLGVSVPSKPSHRSLSVEADRRGGRLAGARICRIECTRSMSRNACVLRCSGLCEGASVAAWWQPRR